MTREFDRELLFGLLAVRQGAMTPVQLVAAVRALCEVRAHAKENVGALADLLVEQQVLAQEDAQRLVSLVAQRLAEHGGDAQACLAALDWDREVVTQLQALCAPELDESLAIVSIAGRADRTDDTIADSSEGSGAQQVERTANAGGRFRVLRPHAKGGLGEVYVARDEELHRDVALKEIQGRFVQDGESRARFVLEAEITGGLEHPGIVPVYGLGHYADGRPYYAMRFIQGDSLKEAIERFHSHNAQGRTTTDRNLELRQLLKRFIDVCQAIAYAHSRGVLHRDLKPGNIMLGKYGETLVVDWGLAKVQGRSDAPPSAAHSAPDLPLQPHSGGDVSPTQYGQWLGTPAYMPPEQAAGQLERLGPASDVYSLGATLYHLLVGRAPFGGQDVRKLLEDVQAGNFPRPRSVRPEVPAALESICLQAMARDPALRYASPQLLAQDVERYLADEPVAAHPESLPVRARRWARKHPALTATSAAVVLLSALGLGVFSAILGSKNQQLADLNDSLDGKNRELTAAVARESEARDRAETNEALAREQSQLALATLREVVDDIQNGLKSFPGSGAIRRRLLTTALERLERTATRYVRQSTVDHATTWALLELGDVVLQFGGDEEIASVVAREFTVPVSMTVEQENAVTLAEALYQRAVDIAKQSIAAAPDSSEAQRDLAAACTRMGDLQMRLGDNHLALRNYRESLRAFRRLAAAARPRSTTERDVAVALSRLGDALLETGDAPAAYRALEESLQFFERQAADAEDDVQAQVDFSTVLIQWGRVLRASHEQEAASAAFERALETGRTLAASAPENVQVQHLLTDALGQVSAACLQSGEFAIALGASAESLAIYRKAAEAAPDDRESQGELSDALNTVAYVQLRLGDFPAALGAAEESAALARRLSESLPTDYYARQRTALALERVGEACLGLGDLAAALRAHEESLGIRRELSAADPTDRNMQLAVNYSWRQVANVHLQADNLAGARDGLIAVLEFERQLAAAAPNDVPAGRQLALSLQRLGDVQLQMGELAAALEAHEESLSIRRQLAAAAPHDVPAQRDLAFMLERIGETCLQTGDLAAALEAHEESLSIRRRLAAADPADIPSQHAAVFSLERVAEVQLRSANLAAALEAHEESLSIRRQLAAAAPHDVEAQENAIYTLYQLADLQRQAGNSAAVCDHLAEALELRRRLAAAAPYDAQARRNLAFTLFALGNAQSALGAAEAARHTLTEALELYRQVAAAAPNDVQARRDTSQVLQALGNAYSLLGETDAALQAFAEALESYRELTTAAPDDVHAWRETSAVLIAQGNAHSRLGEMELALRAYAEALEIRRGVADAIPDDLQARRDVAFVLERMGDIHLQTGEIAAALEAHEESLSIRRRLAAADPADIQAQRAALFSLERVADVRLRSADLAAACDVLTDALAVRRQLAAAAPDDVQAQQDVTAALRKLGEIHVERQDQAAAVWAYEQALEHLRRMIAQGQDVAHSQSELPLVEDALATARSLDIALGEWATLLAQPAEDLPRLLLVRAIGALRRARYADAVQAAAKLLECESAAALQRYNAACVFALSAASVRPAEGQELTVEQTQQRQEWIDAALAALRSAVQAGYDHYDWMAIDADLAILRDLPEFQALLATLPAAEPPTDAPEETPDAP